VTVLCKREIVEDDYELLETKLNDLIINEIINVLNWLVNYKSKYDSCMAVRQVYQNCGFWGSTSN